MKHLLYSKIEDAGYKIRTFDVKHLEEIRTTFQAMAEQGLIDETFYRNNLRSFCYDHQSVLPNAKSVIIIAAPQYKSIAEFQYGGELHELIIPPTYMFATIKNNITGILKEVLTDNGHHFSSINLPLKLVAVRSGLGEYGRNNICYVLGFGSFLRLAAYVTDYPFDESSWDEPKTMQSCDNCSACSEHCPTGAIDKSRFLIYAHKCLTNFNEEEGPMPAWVNPDWHHAIVGCMKCQQACPQNRNRLDFVENRIHFSEEETEAILKPIAFDSLFEETKAKIIQMDMDSYFNILPRNIRYVIERRHPRM